MITLYLVRHGQPELGLGKDSVCLGRKDLPLSHEGEKQAGRLALYFKSRQVDAVYASSLIRCKDTASILAEKSGHSNVPVQVVSGLEEMDTGHWDGMTFAEIRQKYPEEYEERGRNFGIYAIPGGESLMQAGRRFASAVEGILEKEKEMGGEDRHIVLVSHAGVMKTLLCRWTGKDIEKVFDYSLPYASLTKAEIDFPDDISRRNAAAYPESEDRQPFRVRIVAAGLRPVESISLSEADRMWGECGVDMPLRRHMEAVADIAMNLIGYDMSLVRQDCMDTAYPCGSSHLNTRLVYYAALLHDIKRMEGGREHAEKGAVYLEQEGYKELAALVRMHHDPQVYREGQPLNEAELVYYADKMVQGDRPVTIEERFEGSRKKSYSQEALKNHELRFQAALAIGRKIR